MSDPVLLAGKLRPLMPERIARWFRARETADPELRDLLDRRIETIAARVLGNHRDKILLSLPSKTTIAGTFDLGTVVYEREKWPAGLSAAELLQGVAIFGRSGSGKTNLVLHMLEQLTDRGVPWLFLDWKRTGRHALPRLCRPVSVFTPGRTLSPFPFNPFLPPPGLDPHVYIGHVLDTMAEAYTLGDGALNLLQRALSACLEETEAPTAERIAEAMERLPVAGRSHGWRASARRALGSLSFSRLVSPEPPNQGNIVRSLLHGRTILELDGLARTGTKFLIPLLCLWLYSIRLAAPDREKLRLAIIVEEAHHLLRRRPHASSESVMEMLLRQGREIGLAHVVVDQAPHLISHAVLGNTYTVVCLNLKDPSDLARAAALCHVPEDEKTCFSRLPVGFGVVRLQDRWLKPFVIRIPHVPVDKGSVTDEALRAALARHLPGSGRGRPLGAAWPQVRRSQLGGSVLSGDELRLLEDVVAYPDDGVKARYKRLGLSGERGHRAKAALVRNAWLEAETVPVGRSRKVVMRLSPAARAALGLGDASWPRESVRHEYFKRVWADRLHAQGYEVAIEALRGDDHGGSGGGRIDVLACRGEETLGVEVETGRSDAVANVKAGLRAGIARIVVAATDRDALARVGRELAVAGLLVPTRVRVVLGAEEPVWADPGGD